MSFAVKVAFTSRKLAWMRLGIAVAGTTRKRSHKGDYIPISAYISAVSVDNSATAAYERYPVQGYIIPGYRVLSESIRTTNAGIISSISSRPNYTSMGPSNDMQLFYK